MKIVLSSIHPRLLSGQIDSLIGLGRQLERLGHEVELVTAFNSADLSPAGRLRPKAIVGRSLPGKLVRIGRILGQLVAAGRQADLIHFALPTPAFSVLGDILQALVPVPVVVGYEAHLADPADLLAGRRLFDDPGFYLPRLLVNNPLVARVSRYACPSYVVSTDWQRQELLRLGLAGDRIAVVPNLLDEDKLCRWDRAAARAQLGLPAAPIVAYAGHYHHVKGVDLLVEAFAAVAAAQPEARLVLAWSGVGDAEPIETAIDRHGLRPRLIQLGRIDVSSLLAAADVFVLPYRCSIGQQALPNLLLEAMQVGVPLVTTDLPLWRDLVGRAALLAPREDRTGLTAAIDRLLAEPAIGRQLIRRQRLLMAGALAPATLARSYVDVYEAALARQAEVLRAPGDQPVLRRAAIWRSKRGVGEPAGAEARGRPVA